MKILGLFIIFSYLSLSVPVPEPRSRALPSATAIVILIFSAPRLVQIIQSGESHASVRAAAPIHPRQGRLRLPVHQLADRVCNPKSNALVPIIAAIRLI